MADHTSTAPSWLGLENLRVVVAGAGGIGGACALAYLAAGARVLVVDRNEDALAALAGSEEVRAASGNTRQADLTEPGPGGRAVETRLEQLGGRDGVLPAVAITGRRPILDFTE